MPTHLSRRQRERLQRLAAGERSRTPPWLQPLHDRPKTHVAAARTLAALTTPRHPHRGDTSPPLHLPAELLPPLG